MSWRAFGARRALFTAGLVGLAVIVLIAILATRSTPPDATVATPLFGKVAPAVNGASVTNGAAVDLARLRGRYVYVDFFASWCAPCQQEAPELESFLFEHRHSSNISMIGVVVADSAGNARAFLERTGASWPAVADANGAIALAYDVDDPPQIFLVSPSGRVVGHVEGAATRTKLDALLSAAQASVAP